MPSAFLLSVLWSCADPKRAEAASTSAVLDVLASLDEATERASAGDPAAAEAWERAQDRFEDEVEPILRRRHSPADVARIEYQFARIGAALQKGESPELVVEALGDELRRLLPRAQ